MATRRIRHILVAVKDPSAAALPAVTKAAQLAKALGAELTLFQALSTPLNLSEDLPPRHMVLGTLEDYTRSAHEACLEGLALRLFDMRMVSPAMVKDAALSSLVSRFDGWRADAAARRRAVAATLLQALEPEAAAPLALAMDDAARVLDVGRSLDVVNRHDHVAEMLLIADVNGASHEELAFASAIARRAGDRHAGVPRLAPLREASASGLLDRAAVILALADEIEARCPPGRRIIVSCTAGRHVTLSIPTLSSWLMKDLDKRFERAFGRRLVVTGRR